LSWNEKFSGTLAESIVHYVTIAEILAS